MKKQQMYFVTSTEVMKQIYKYTRSVSVSQPLEMVSVILIVIPYIYIYIYDLVPKGAHARGYALQLKIKHC